MISIFNSLEALQISCEIQQLLSSMVQFYIPFQWQKVWLKSQSHVLYQIVFHANVYIIDTVPSLDEMTMRTKTVSHKTLKTPSTS